MGALLWVVIQIWVPRAKKFENRWSIESPWPKRGAFSFLNSKDGKKSKKFDKLEQTRTT